MLLGSGFFSQPSYPLHDGPCTIQYTNKALWEVSMTYQMLIPIQTLQT